MISPKTKNKHSLFGAKRQINENNSRNEEKGKNWIEEKKGVRSNLG
jgi:hypothetical protein